jgi:NCS1 family nucleobase:cation symporter-1
MAIDIPIQGQDTMPSREGDLTVEGHGIEPIPEANRYGSLSRVFTVWFPINLVPAAFFLGTLATLDFIGLGFWTGLAAIIVGNVIGAAVVGLLATMGPRTGMAQIPLSRFPFGKAIVVPGLINWLSTIAWDAINSIFGAGAIVVLTGGALPFWLALVIIVAFQVGLSIIGYEAIHTYERYAAIGLGILFAVVTVALLPKANFALADQAAAGLGTFVLMTTIVASFTLAWALYASDYTRYLPSNSPPRTIFLYTFAATALGAVWIETLGLAVATSLGSGDRMQQINDLVGGGLIGALAMVAVVFGTVAVNAVNDYTGSLSLLAAGVRVWRPISAVVVGVLAFFATLWLYYNDFAQAFENYLLIITYWIGPWVAIVLVDWYLRKGKFDTSLVRDFARLASGRNALIALVVGFVVSIPFFNQSLYFGPGAEALGGADIAYVVGFVVAGLVYWVIERASPTAAMAMEPMGSMGSMESMGSAESMAPMEPMPPTEPMAPVDSMAPKPMAPMGGEQGPMPPAEPMEPKGEDSGM